MAISAVAGLASAIGGAIAVNAGALTLAAFTATLFSATGAALFALGAGMSMLSRALAPKPNIGAQLRGITQTTRDPAGSRKLVYGQIRVGGQIVFIANSGQTNEYLHLAVAFASHEIESFEEFWLNDKKVYENGAVTSDWSDVVTITKFDGTQTTADSTLTSVSNKWTSNHVLNGIAYAHFRLKWDQDKFPQGVPNISAVLKGKKVYDPRDTNQSATDSSTWTYSQNPALCLRDYLVDSKYGLGEDHTLIDDTALEDAADLCDESVSLSGGGTQNRYKLNGVIDTSNQIKDNIEQMLSAMGGRVSYSGGKYFIAGAEYQAPTVSFDEADVVSDIQVQTKQSRRGAYNGVKGIFVSEEKDYKVLDYPAQISSTYATEDGDPIYLDMPLPFVTNNFQAQRIAKIALLRSRQQTVVTMTVNLKGLRVKVGDTINVSNTHLGYSSKVFEVIDYSLAISYGALAVNLTCIETASAVYDWDTSDELDFLSGGELDLYDGRTVDNVTGLSHTVISLKGPDGKNITNVDFTWTAPNDAFVEFYVVTVEKDNDGNVYEYQTRQPRLRVPNLDIGSAYEVIVKAQNLIGVRSTGTTLNIASLAGDTTAPSPVTNVTITSGLKNLTVEWTNPTDTDLAYVQIYVGTTATKPASPVAQVNGTEYVYPAASGEGKGTIKYFWLEAVDYSGNVSTTVGPEYENIQLPKSEEIDGAVSEVITFGLYNATSHTVTSSLTTYGSFSTPAPENSVKKRATLLAMMGISAVTPSGDFTVGVRIERKSKGATTGTSLGTVVADGGVAFGARYIEVAGNVMSEIDMYGGIATSATSPSAVYNVVSVEYQTSTNRTRIIYASSTVISSGDIYYNPDKWTSSGTWLTYAPFTEPRYNVLGITALANHVIFQPLAASDSAEDYRIRAVHYVLTSGTVTMTVGIAGQIQFTR